MATVVDIVEERRQDERAPLSHDDAFKTYVIPEIDVLYRVALSITRRHQDAEDLVQDTLLRAYRAIGSFDGRYPRAWLLTIMRNAQVNRTRRRRPELLRDQDAAHDRLAAEPSAEYDPETAVVDETFDAAVTAALDALPPKFRRIVELVDIDDLSYAETAQVLGVPIGTVMSRLHRARRRLRKDIVAAGMMPPKAPDSS